MKRHEKIFGESQWMWRREVWGYLGPFPSYGSEGVAMAVESGRRWRERKRWRDAGCGGEADPLFLPGWTHPLFLPGVVHPLFLTGWREEQQGRKGGGGGGGRHPLFVPG